MNYRLDKYGNKISTLGFGCMRFPKVMGSINIDEAEKEILEAYKLGVNYYDTAYVYPGSENAIGQIFEKNNMREDIMIATKLPHYLIRSIDALEKTFNEQLKRLRTDYIDVYLMHMLTDIATWNRLKELEIEDWIEDKKRSGKIRQIGFSYHGNSYMFCELIDAYPWDICQIQYNYMDENSQAGRTGLNYAYSKGIPVVIMEPLRGGKLVNKLPQEALKLFSEHEPKHTPAQWAFRWLWDQKEVTCVLSGMNSVEMVIDNSNTASSTSVGDLTLQDQQMLSEVSKAINAKMRVGCTGCGYCMPCPKGVDIPGAFAAYNRSFAENTFEGFYEYMMCTAIRKNTTAASNCIECGKCEKHCPQGIAIRQELKNVKRKFENPIYKIIQFGCKKIL